MSTTGWSCTAELWWFRAGSLGEAARLAEAVAQVAGFEGSGALLTIADARLTVRLTRDMWQIEPRHVELARAAETWREVGRSPGTDRSTV